MTHRDLFWLKIFRLSCIFVLVTGLLPSLAVFESTQEPWRLFFDVLTWPIDHVPGDFSAGERQLSAVLGGVLCGWALLLYQLGNPKIFTPRLRQPMIQSVWLWFILDSGGSVLAGIPLNAVSNVGFLLALWLPLRALSSTIP